MSMYINEKKYLSTLTLNSSTQKGWRWILKGNEVHCSSIKNEKIEKVLDQIYKDLNKIGYSSLDITDELANLRLTLIEKVKEYKQRHSKIYLIISRLIWGDVDELNSNIIKKINNLQVEIVNRKKDKEEIDSDYSVKLVTENYRRQRLADKNSTYSIKNIQTPSLAINPISGIPANSIKVQQETLTKELSLSEKAEIAEKVKENQTHNSKLFFSACPTPVIFKMMEHLDFPSILSLNRTMKFFVNLLRPNFANYVPLRLNLERLLKKYQFKNFNNYFNLMVWLGSKLDNPEFTGKALNPNQIKILFKNCQNIINLNLSSQVKLTNQDLPLLSTSIIHLDLSSTHGLRTGAMELLKNNKIQTLILNYCAWFQDEDFNNLPDSLMSLTLYNNKNLKKISKFPDQIKTFVLNNRSNRIEIPEKWPKSLENLHLSLDFNSTRLPKEWPESLIKLSFCGCSGGDVFPEKWPPKLKRINLDNSHFITNMINNNQFPPLPPSIEFIDLRNFSIGLAMDQIFSKDCKNLRYIVLDLNSSAGPRIREIKEIYQSYSLKIILLTDPTSTDTNNDLLIQEIKKWKLSNIELDVVKDAQFTEADYEFDRKLGIPN
jgi:hypothetical protein